MRSLLFINGLILASLITALGQTLPEVNKFIIDENDLIETRWKYTYTFHPKSKTILHNAGEDYNYFLHFKYDHTYHQYVNGDIDGGTWSMDRRTLNYSYKHIDQFEIMEITSDQMVLQFSQPNSNGTYQYHFISVTADESPFERPAYELPLVIVETEIHEKFKFQRKKKKKGLFQWLFGWLKKDSKDLADEEERIYLNIELIGGGYYGGIDPVIKDFVHIKTDGRLIHEFSSLKRGNIITKGNIDRIELEEFIDYIELVGFFEFDRIFDCETSACQKRKRIKPRPTPLRLAITKGTKKNVISIPIYGQDDRKIKYIDYPKELDYIIETIQRMAARSSADPLASH
jgi:hypothetical protein